MAGKRMPQLRTIPTCDTESGGLRRRRCSTGCRKRRARPGRASPEEEAAGGDAAGSDLAGKSKEELLAIFARMLEERPVQSLRRDVEALKIAFYKLRRAESDAARRAFVEAGGAEGEFVSEPDPAELRFKDLFREYRRLRDEFVAGLEAAKEENLKISCRSSRNSRSWLRRTNAQPDFQQVPGVAASLERDRGGAPAECEGSVGDLQPARGEFLQFHQDQQGVARSRPEEELRAEAGLVRTGRSAGARTVDRRSVPQTAEVARRMA